MKAIVYEKCGSPDVVRLRDIALLAHGLLSHSLRSPALRRACSAGASVGDYPGTVRLKPYQGTPVLAPAGGARECSGSAYDFLGVPKIEDNQANVTLSPSTSSG